MNPNIVIECRQKDSKTHSIANGDYKVDVQGVKVNPGDVISMRGCFLDTVSSNENNIQIKDDLLLTIGVGVYMYDWNSDHKNYSSVNANNQPTGQMYYMINNNSLEDVSDAKFIFNDQQGPNGGGFDCTFSYLDENDEEKEITKFLPKFDSATYTLNFNPNIRALKNSFRLKNPPLETSKSTSAELATYWDGYTSTPVAGDRYGPALFRRVYKLPKGNYKPDDLANEITRILSENGPNPDSNFASDSPFLHVTSQFDDTYSNGDGPLFIVADGKDDNFSNKRRFTMHKGEDYWVGTNQVALQWDQNLNKFVWSYLHMCPLDHDGNLSAGYVKRDNTNVLIPYAKNSGVFFMQFDSEYKNLDEDIDLLSIMGFDRNQLIVNVSDYRPRDGEQQQVITTKLEDSVNTTSQFIGLDALIDKSGDYYKARKNTSILATSDVTVEVTASNQYQETETGADQPYFLVEVNANFKTDYYSQSYIKRNIKAIVSKYYAYKSFTVGDESNDLTYQHIGDPIYLTGFHIRILDPDLNLADDLGDDNTVFLEIKRIGPERELLNEGKKP